MKIPELLAPAGDAKRAETALRYGADAVYFGGKRGSLRARASNFTLADIASTVHLAHALQKKAYVTVNIIPHDEDLESIADYLKELAAIGTDAIIVSSLAIARLAKEVAPNLERHASTQLSTLNSVAVRFLLQEGFSRVVLGREMSLDEIEALSQEYGGALEVFIHGGMCLSYSGRCVLSNHLTGRDANRGGCAHCCRWDYQYENEPFYLGARDLEGIEALPRLVSAGVASLKIEGRMKSAYYLAVVVGLYRRLLDAIARGEEPDWRMARAELASAESRPGSSGYFFGDPGVKETMACGMVHEDRQDFLGVVMDYDLTRKEVTLLQRNHFEMGEEVEFIGPARAPLSYRLPEFHTLLGERKSIACIAQETLLFKVPFVLQKGDLMRRKR